jgi:hypothetical protein
MIALILGVFLSYLLCTRSWPTSCRPHEKEKIHRSILIASFLSSAGDLFSIRFVLPYRDLPQVDVLFPGNLNRIISYDSFILFFFQFIWRSRLCLQFPVVLLISCTTRSSPGERSSDSSSTLWALASSWPEL